MSYIVTKCTIKKSFFVLLAVSICSAHAGNGNGDGDGDEVDMKKGDFPWELVIVNKRINGCIYQNTFYSQGSILIEETLPRKCKIDPNRDGYWSELGNRELELYESSVRAQQQLESESMSIRGKSLTKFEIAVIRGMRRQGK